MSEESKAEVNRPSCALLPWIPREDLRSPASMASTMADVPLGEIRRAFEGLAEKYPPILNVQQAAELANLAPSTLKRKVSEGCFKQSVSPRKPLRFWRDRFVREIMK